MPIEKDVITTKFKDEGISETLSKGLSFETDAELSEWVSDYKSVLPTPNKKIEDYTKEEIEEIAKDPQFKGAKGLQGYFDSIRQKKTPEKKVEKKTEEVQPQWAIDLQEKLAKQQTTLDENKAKDEAKENLAKATKLIKAQKITEQEDIDMVLLKLGGDFSEANIKTKSEEYTAFLTKKGIKHIPGASDVKLDDAIVSAAKDFTAKKLKQDKKFKTKN